MNCESCGKPPAFPIVRLCDARQCDDSIRAFVDEQHSIALAAPTYARTHVNDRRRRSRAASFSHPISACSKRRKQLRAERAVDDARQSVSRRRAERCARCAAPTGAQFVERESELKRVATPRIERNLRP